MCIDGKHILLQYMLIISRFTILKYSGTDDLYEHALYAIMWNHSLIKSMQQNHHGW